MTPPEVQVGDWVQITPVHSSFNCIEVETPEVAALYSGEWSHRVWRIRGTRNGQPWHWTREGK